MPPHDAPPTAHSLSTTSEQPLTLEATVHQLKLVLDQHDLHIQQDENRFDQWMVQWKHRRKQIEEQLSFVEHHLEEFGDAPSDRPQLSVVSADCDS